MHNPHGSLTIPIKCSSHHARKFQAHALFVMWLRTDAAAALHHQLACADSAGGFAIGFALGFITKWLLGLLRSRGAKAPEEMALTLAMAYLAFYLANAPGASSQSVNMVYSLGLGKEVGVMGRGGGLGVTKRQMSHQTSLTGILSDGLFIYAMQVRWRRAI